MSREHIDADNRDSLVVYEELREAVEECRRHHEFLNLATIFFHDLMRVLTGFALRRNELARGTVLTESEPLVQFPYVGYDDIRGHLRSGDKDLAVPKDRRYARLAKNLLAAVVSPRTPAISIAGNLEFSGRQVITCLRRKGGRARFVPALRRVWVPDLDQQEAATARMVERVCARLGAETRTGELTHLVTAHLRNRTQARKMRLPTPKILLTGSLMNSQATSTAATVRAAGGTVISVMHGHQFGAYDEPHIGYGETTFPSYTIGYGTAENIGLAKMTYARSLVDQPHYVAGDSDPVRERLSSEEVRPLSSYRRPRLLYVPTNLSGQTRWGPYRDIADRHYVAWQKTVIETFPDLMLKLHPKDVIDPRTFGVPSDRAAEGGLHPWLDTVDVFLFDCVSSGFAAAAATDKPIIYCDIGLRRLSDRGRRAVQDRCIWFEAEPGTTTAEELHSAVHAQRDDAKRNWFSRCFSLADAVASEPRLSVVLRTVTEGHGK